jgi:hypothetical protein
MPGEQVGDSLDHVAKRDRTHASTRTRQQRQHHQPGAATSDRPLKPSPPRLRARDPRSSSARPHRSLAASGTLGRAGGPVRQRGARTPHTRQRVLSWPFGQAAHTGNSTADRPSPSGRQRRDRGGRCRDPAERHGASATHDQPELAVGMASGSPRIWTSPSALGRPNPTPAIVCRSERHLSAPLRAQGCSAKLRSDWR